MEPKDIGEVVMYSETKTPVVPNIECGNCDGIMFPVDDNFMAARVPGYQGNEKQNWFCFNCRAVMQTDRMEKITQEAMHGYQKGLFQQGRG
jgi:uncharacterized protein with PIN domain